MSHLTITNALIIHLSASAKTRFCFTSKIIFNTIFVKIKITPRSHCYKFEMQSFKRRILIVWFSNSRNRKWSNCRFSRRHQNYCCTRYDFLFASIFEIHHQILRERTDPRRNNESRAFSDSR